MRPVMGDIIRNEEGMVIWGSPDGPGCPHCGEVDIKISKHNDAVVYHAALHCCEKRLREQIRIRQDELSGIAREREKRRQAAQDVRDKNPRDLDAGETAHQAFEAWDAATREWEAEVLDDLRTARDILTQKTRHTRLPYKDQD